MAADGGGGDTGGGERGGDAADAVAGATVDRGGGVGWGRPVEPRRRKPRESRGFRRRFC